jgi:hypothetical protein
MGRANLRVTLEAWAMAIWYRLGLSWRHERIEEGASPDIVPPLGVMGFIPLAAISLPVSFIYSFGADLDVAREILLAVFGGVAPIAIAYGVMTNRRWSRLLIVVSAAMSVWIYAGGPPSGAMWSIVSSSWPVGAAVAVWLSITTYLYCAKKPRAYYLLLAGAPLPDNLRDVDLSPPRVVVRLMAYLSYLSEWVLMLLALAIFFGFLVVSY